MKFSDLKTESVFFYLRAESIISDSDLRSGAFGGGGGTNISISLPLPHPLKLRTPLVLKKHADVILERTLDNFGSVGGKGGNKPNLTMA